MATNSPKQSMIRFIAGSAIGTILCLLAIGSILLFWPQNTIENKVKITIPSGTTLAGISEILSEKDIVTNNNMFITATKILGYSNKIPAGIFSLKRANNNYQIVKQLTQATPEMVKVTLLEGWTIPQITQAIADSLMINPKKLASLCYDEKFIQELEIDAPSLEGYLYPDTYLFMEGEDNYNDIIRQIVSEFQKVFTDQMRNRAEQIGFTVTEVLAMASIIEGEAIYDSERAIISAVYHNRLKNRMLLQADPTIQYIIEDGPRRLRLSDLKIDSPYNTYLYTGLPIGPIGNPGKASILAALYPEENDYLFFVARGDGYHTFTRSIEEHNRAKQEFQKVRRLAANG